MAIDQKYLNKLERIFLKEGIEMHGYEFEQSMDQALEEAEEGEFAVELKYGDTKIIVYGSLSEQLRKDDTPYIQTGYDGLEFIKPNGEKIYHEFIYGD